ncbi:hypothetical protein PUNSTDRAFT_57472, partial [Punctularia strigosozonata HHB-11173 SS5]|uniref:uncharacterized protein n=1 Tax=Punctularia strigosozonata (strain HHB-11173) TaxID=741275 RepID=UPI0004418397
TVIDAPAVPSTPSRSPKKGSSSAGRTPKRMSKKAEAEAKAARLATYANDLFSDLNRSVFDNGLPKETTLVWNKRLLSTAGKASWHRRVFRHRSGKETTKIELATKVLDCEERIRHTLAHEMCHLASWTISGQPKEGHGKIFKSWAVKVMRKRPEIEVSTRHSYVISHPYEWKCTECSKIYGRFAKTIDVNVHMCGACKKGRLVAMFTTRTTKAAKESAVSRMGADQPRGKRPCIRSIPASYSIMTFRLASPSGPNLDGVHWIRLR